MGSGRGGRGDEVDSGGTTNLLHFTLGLHVLQGGAKVIHLLRSPIVLATASGVALSALGVRLPGWIAVSLEMLGQISVPLLLFTLGVRMSATALAALPVGIAGALVRPAIGVAVAVALAPSLGLSGVQHGILILYASLPPAVLNFLLAEQYRQEPEKVASIVVLGHVVSLVAVPLALAVALRGG